MTKNKRPSAEERRKALKARTQKNIKNKDRGGKGGKRVLDFSSCEDIVFYKPEEGINKIDILPYIIKTDNHPQREEAGMEKGFEDYILDVFVHSFVGPMEESFLCMKRTFGKPCPICEEQSNLRKDGADEKEINALNAKRRVFYNIIDTKNRDKGIQVFEVSHYLFEKELLEEAETSDDEMVTFADIEEGKTIKFRAKEETKGGYSFMAYKSFSFQDRKEEYDESILDETYSFDELLNIPTYEEVHDALHGISEDEPEEDIEETDEQDETKEDEKAVEKPKTKNKCPHDHEFGIDIDDFKECRDCEEWDECADAS